MKIVEIFGPTIQGEGALCGVPTHFIRFFGCDYRCEWCDSPHAVLPELDKSKDLSVNHIRTAIHDLAGSVSWITFSGGNPFIIKKDMYDLIDGLMNDGYKVNVETQGTFWQKWGNECDLITVSPKPPSSGNETEVEVLGKFLNNTGRAMKVILKVVVASEEDYEYARRVRSLFGLYEFYIQVANIAPGLQTVGNPNGNPTEFFSFQPYQLQMKWLFEKVMHDGLMHNVSVLPQMHLLAWGNQRGI